MKKTEHTPPFLLIEQIPINFLQRFWKRSFRSFSSRNMSFFLPILFASILSKKYELRQYRKNTDLESVNLPRNDESFWQYPTLFLLKNLETAPLTLSFLPQIVKKFSQNFIHKETS